MQRTPASRFTLAVFAFGCWGEADPPPRESDAVYGGVGIGRGSPGEGEGGDNFGGAYFGGGMPNSGGGPQIGDGPGVNDIPGIGDQPGQTGGGPQNQGGGFGQGTDPPGQETGGGGAGDFGVIIVID